MMGKGVNHTLNKHQPSQFTEFFSSSGMVTGTSVGTSFSSTSSASSNPVGSAPAAPGHRQRSKIWWEKNGATMLLLIVANRQTHPLRFAVASHYLQGF